MKVMRVTTRSRANWFHKKLGCVISRTLQVCKAVDKTGKTPHRFDITQQLRDVGMRQLGDVRLPYIRAA